MEASRISSDSSASDRTINGAIVVVIVKDLIIDEIMEDMIAEDSMVKKEKKLITNLNIEASNFVCPRMVIKTQQYKDLSRLLYRSVSICHH